MADPFDWNVGLSIDLFLERKDDQHAIGNAPHRLDPAGPPRPELGGDVVNDRHAEALHGVREAEVEIGEVDGDEHVGTRLGRVCHELPVHGVRTRQHARNLEQTGDRQPLEVRDQTGAASAQAFASEAGDRRRRIARQDLARERAGIEISRRLTAGDQDPHGIG